FWSSQLSQRWDRRSVCVVCRHCYWSLTDHRRRWSVPPVSTSSPKVYTLTVCRATVAWPLAALASWQVGRLTIGRRLSACATSSCSFHIASELPGEAS